MANDKSSWEFLKNWGWAIFMLVTISVFIATMISHSGEMDIHMTLKENEEHFVPREIFDLTIKNIEKDMAYMRKLLDKIDRKLDE